MTRISITIENRDARTEISLEREQELPALLEAVNLLVATRRAEIRRQLGSITKLWQMLDKREQEAEEPDVAETTCMCSLSAANPRCPRHGMDPHQP